MGKRNLSFHLGQIYTQRVVWQGESLGLLNIKWKNINNLAHSSCLPLVVQQPLIHFFSSFCLVKLIFDSRRIYLIATGKPSKGLAKCRLLSTGPCFLEDTGPGDWKIPETLQHCLPQEQKHQAAFLSLVLVFPHKKGCALRRHAGGPDLRV